MAANAALMGGRGEKKKEKKKQNKPKTVPLKAAAGVQVQHAELQRREASGNDT